MRSRRTTYLLLFLAFLFILTIIILCLVPSEGSVGSDKERLINLPEDKDYSTTNTSPESTTWRPSSTTSETPKTTEKHKTSRALTTMTMTPTTEELSSTTRYTTESTTKSTSTTTRPTTKLKTTRQPTTETQTETPTTTPTTKKTTTSTTTTTKRTKPTTTESETISSTSTMDPSTTQESSSTTMIITRHTTTSSTTLLEETTLPETTVEAETTSTEKPTTTTTSTTTKRTTTSTTEPPTTTTEPSTTTTEPSTTTMEPTTTTTSTTTTTTQPTTTITSTTTAERTTTEQTTTTEPTTTEQTTTTEPTTTEQTTTTEPTTTEQTTTTEPTTTEQTTTTETTTTTTEQTTTPYHHPNNGHLVVEKGVCSTDDCKKIASKMMDSIDHSVDICEDFYQYSCGGVENDPFLSPENQQVILNSILKDELFKGQDRDISKFYDSCTKFTNNPDKESIITNVTKFIENIVANNNRLSGPQKSNFPSVSSLLSNFMKKNFPLFFDVVVEPCDYDDLKYCPRLSLSSLDFPETPKMEESFCLSKFEEKKKLSRRDNGTVDLNDEYNEYKQCMVLPAVEDRINQLRKTFKLLDFSEDFLSNDTEEHLNDLTEFLSEYGKIIVDFNPTEVKRELKEEIFELLSIESLGRNSEFSKFIDLNPFIIKDLELKLKPHQAIRVYHSEKLKLIFNFLHGWESNTTTLSQILIMLGVEHFQSYFNFFDDSEIDVCFKLTKNLFPLHTQRLFLKYLKTEDIYHRLRHVVREIGDVSVGETEAELKNSSISHIETLSPQLLNTTVEIANADINFLERNIKTYKYDAIITGDHVMSVIKLREKLRKDNYALISRTKVDSQDNIFLFKFEEAHHQFIDDKLLIPISSVVDPPLLLDMKVPNYVKFAGIAHFVAGALLRKFNLSDLLISGPSPSKCFMRDSPEIISVTNQHNVEGTFKLHNVDHRSLKLEYEATTLAWKVLKHFRAEEESPLIWFGSDTLSPMQTYFIKKAQTMCEASSDFQLLPTVRESLIPTRIRVNLLLKYEPLFGTTFNCSQTSKLHSQPCAKSKQESKEFLPIIAFTFPPIVTPSFDYGDDYEKLEVSGN